MADDRPNPLQYIAYCYGRTLPASMHDWVRKDLAGKGARRRTMVRVAIPALLIIAPLWLIPTTTYMHLAMSALLFLPFLYFAHALDKIWRAHRLRQHGLDPGLVDELTRKRDAHIHEEYRKRHGRAD
jgi:hypothetical protein